LATAARCHVRGGRVAGQRLKDLLAAFVTVSDALLSAIQNWGMAPSRACCGWLKSSRWADRSCRLCYRARPRREGPAVSTVNSAPYQIVAVSRDRRRAKFIEVRDLNAPRRQSHGLLLKRSLPPVPHTLSGSVIRVWQDREDPPGWVSAYPPHSPARCHRRRHGRR